MICSLDIIFDLLPQTIWTGSGRNLGGSAGHEIHLFVRNHLALRPKLVPGEQYNKEGNGKVSGNELGDVENWNCRLG